jgi:hypothetical protein
MPKGPEKYDPEALAESISTERAQLTALGAFVKAFSQLEFTIKARISMAFMRYRTPAECARCA